MTLTAGRVYPDRGDRWYIRLKDGTKIYCDKAHRTFYSRQHAAETLLGIQGEMKSEKGFDAAFYSKTKKSIHSFEVYAQEWLRNQERRFERGDISPFYIKSLRRWINDVFIPAFGQLNIADVTGRQLKSFFLGLTQSPKTQFNIMGGLHRIFKDAVDEEVIQRVPKFPMEFRQSALPDPHWQWASAEQQNAILEHLSFNAFYFIYFLMTHGCRPGEARALRYSDLNIKDDTVTFQSAFSGSVLRPFTKTKRIRTVPLDPSWKELLLTQPRNINPQAFVFTLRGEPLTEKWARKQWEKAVKKSGFTGLTLYQGTRHSFASQAVNNGISLDLIGKFLGHSTHKMTERYAHVQTASLRQVQRRADVRPIFRKVSATASGGK